MHQNILIQMSSVCLTVEKSSQDTKFIADFRIVPYNPITISQNSLKSHRPKCFQQSSSAAEIIEISIFFCQPFCIFRVFIVNRKYLVKRQIENES